MLKFISENEKYIEEEKEYNNIKLNVVNTDSSPNLELRTLASKTVYDAEDPRT